MKTVCCLRFEKAIKKVKEMLKDFPEIKISDKIEESSFCADINDYPTLGIDENGNYIYEYDYIKNGNKLPLESGQRFFTVVKVDDIDYSFVYDLYSVMQNAHNNKLISSGFGIVEGACDYATFEDDGLINTFKYDKNDKCNVNIIANGPEFDEQIIYEFLEYAVSDDAADRFAEKYNL
jgi:hypothetical protein